MLLELPECLATWKQAVFWCYWKQLPCVSVEDRVL